MNHLPPAAAHFRAYVQLRSVDPACNRDRSYILTWQPGLIGDGALMRCWGRTGGAERTRIDSYRGCPPSTMCSARSAKC